MRSIFIGFEPSAVHRNRRFQAPFRTGRRLVAGTTERGLKRTERNAGIAETIVGGTENVT